MEELSRKFQRIDWKNLQRQAAQVRRSTASALKDLVMTDLENKVRAVTADTSWGASQSDLALIAQATYHREDYTLIMTILWQRLQSSRWRCVLKGLELLKHLICFGAHRVRDEVSAAMYHLKSLESYRFVDKMTGRDHGAVVREKAQLVCALISDEELLEDYKREHSALKNKVRKSGAISSEDYGGSGGGGAGGFRAKRIGTNRPSQYGGGSGDDGDGGHYDDVPSSSRRGRQNGTDGGGFGGFDANGKERGSKNIDELLGGGEPVLAIESKESVEQTASNRTDLMAMTKSGESGKGADANGLDDLFDGIPDQPAQSGQSNPQESNVLAGIIKSSMKTNTMADEASDSILDGPDGASIPNDTVTTQQTQSIMSGSGFGNVEIEKKPSENTAYGGLVHFDNIMLNKEDRAEPKRSIRRTDDNSTSTAGNPFASVGTSTTTTTTTTTMAGSTVTSSVSATVEESTKKLQKNLKDDPFADLLSAAKKGQ